MESSWVNNYWVYKVDPNFSENNFNEFEKRNINYLINLERMIPLQSNRLVSDFSFDKVTPEELFIINEDFIISDELETYVNDSKMIISNDEFDGGKISNRSVYLVVVCSIILIIGICIFTKNNKKSI